MELLLFTVVVIFGGIVLTIAIGLLGCFLGEFVGWLARQK